MPTPPVPPKPRRRWLRFSLRTLLIVSFLAGSIWLLIPAIPSWRVDYAMDESSAKTEGRTYQINRSTVKERNGKHFCFYQSGRKPFEFDFNATFGSDVLPDKDGVYPSGRRAIAQTFSPDLNQLLVADACHATLYDLDSRRQVRQWALPFGEYDDVVAGELQPPALAYSTDGSRAAVVEESRVIVLDILHGGIVTKFESDEHYPFTDAQFSSDNATLMLIHSTRVSFLDLRNGTLRGLALEDNVDASLSRLVESEKNTLAVHSTKGAMLIDAETGALKAGPWVIPNCVFLKFSEDGGTFSARHYIPDQGLWRRCGGTAVFNSRTGVLLAELDGGTNSELNSGSIDEAEPKASLLPGRLIVSDGDGDAVIKLLNSNRTIRLSRVAQVALFPVLEKEDYLMHISCMVMKSFARHQLNPAGDALFIEREPPYGFPARDDVTLRHFLYRRTHPEEWWGLACTLQFWFTATLGVLLIWSLVRDWRELPR